MPLDEKAQGIAHFSPFALPEGHNFARNKAVGAVKVLGGGRRLPPHKLLRRQPRQPETFF